MIILAQIIEVDNSDFTLSNAKSQRIILYDLINSYENELSNLPSGKISRKIINGKQYLYHFYKLPDGTFKQKAIGKDAELLRLLERKYYIITCVKNLRENIVSLDKFIESYSPNLDKCEKIRLWISEPFDQNDFKIDEKIQTTQSGLKVRSKSEALIAGLLEINNIPFKYEAKLIIDNKQFFPDFTIMRPKDGEIMYWEHFGMTGKQSYAQSMTYKLQCYLNNGIIPWEKLITTFDSSNGSIDASLISNLIKVFLLG